MTEATCASHDREEERRTARSLMWMSSFLNCADALRMLASSSDAAAALDALLVLHVSERPIGSIVWLDFANALAVWELKFAASVETISSDLAVAFRSATAQQLTNIRAR